MFLKVLLNGKLVFGFFLCLYSQRGNESAHTLGFDATAILLHQAACAKSIESVKQSWNKKAYQVLHLSVYLVYGKATWVLVHAKLASLKRKNKISFDTSFSAVFG